MLSFSELSLKSSILIYNISPYLPQSPLSRKAIKATRFGLGDPRRFAALQHCMEAAERAGQWSHQWDLPSFELQETSCIHQSIVGHEALRVSG